MKQLFQEDFNMLRILIDSSADFMLEEAKKLNIEIIRLPVYFGEEIYYQEDDPEFKNFFKKADISSIHPKTSRANSNDYLQVFEDVKNKNDENNHKIHFADFPNIRALLTCSLCTIEYE